MSAYSEALAELEAAERLAARRKTPEALSRVVAARARATALYGRPDVEAAPGDSHRVWIGNRPS